MKKILTAAVLTGLSGTSLMAAATLDLSSLPADIQAQVKNAEAGNGSTPNPAEPYINDLSGLVTNYQGEVESLKQANPYLTNDGTAQGIETILKASYPAVNSDLSGVQGEFGAVNELYNQLVQRTYPYLCKNNPALPIVKGIVRYTSTRKWVLYNTDQVNPKILGYFLDDDIIVGRIGYGSDYNYKKDRNSLVNAQVGSDGKGNNAVVVCVDALGPAPVPPPPPPAK